MHVHVGVVRRETFELAARAGYVARGVVFLIVGGFAMLAALGSGARPAGTKEALERVFDRPGGPILLALLAAGLICFGLWRIAQAVADADRMGRSESALVRRVGFAGSAAFYIGLAIWALLLVAGYAAGGTPRDWTARLMSWPLGEYLVGFVGLGFVATGLVTAARGLRSRFETKLMLGPSKRRFADIVGRLGFIVRGVVLVLIGAFLIGAAVHANPNEAAGLAGALGAVRGTAYGDAVLFVTAVGLLAFGLYQVIEAFYRRVEPPKVLAAQPHRATKRRRSRKRR